MSPRHLRSIIAVPSLYLASLSNHEALLQALRGPSPHVCTSCSLFLRGESGGTSSPLCWGLEKVKPVLKKALFSERSSACRCSGGQETDGAQQVGLAAPRLLCVHLACAPASRETPHLEPSLPPPPRCFLLMQAYWGHSKAQLIRKEAAAPR